MQPRLRVGAAGGRHEREAERTAAHIVGPRGEEERAPELTPINHEATMSGIGPLGPSGPARPLGSAERAFFEPRFGHDFSRVRIHTSEHAERLSARLGARAFAYGLDLYFAPGLYNPQSQAGRRLLAHELSHVVQQGGRARLVQRAPPDDAEALEKLKSKLKSDYGLATIEDGSSTWSVTELEQVRDAFKLLPKKDRTALKGVTLRRVTSLGGKTAGRFGSQQGVSGTTVTNEATLELADRTFRSGAPDSYETIVHEVGHAVATLPLRTAAHAEHEAIATFNRLVDLSNTASDEFNDAVDARNALVDPLNDAIQEYNDARKSGDKTRVATARADYQSAKKAYDAALAEEKRRRATYNAAKKKSDAADAASKAKARETAKSRISQKQLDAIKKTAEDAAKAHKKAREGAAGQASGMSEPHRTESQAYTGAVEEASRAIETFATSSEAQTLGEDEVESQVADVRSKIEARDKQRAALTKTNRDNPALAGHAGLESAQDDWFEAASAHALAHERNARVQKFVAFVESKHIDPITPYAAENWPHKPEEFYAEAYSMYLTRPKALESASKALYDWFKANKY